jgi:predicted Zn-dependent protease
MTMKFQSIRVHIVPRLVGVALALICAGHALAQTLPPVVERYEQMLVRSPGKGTAFEKVYQHFFEGEGVEKLAARWQSLAEAGNANAANYWLLRGLLAERQGRNDEAAGFYENVTRLKPGDWPAWQALGDLQVGMGKFAPAIGAFEKALAAGASAEARPRLYRQLARSQQRNFDPAGAIQTWQKFVAEAPGDPFVIEEAGEALADAERYAEARALFEKLREGAGTDPYQRVRAIIKIAQLEEQQGRSGPARELYESALPLAAEASWMHREVRTRIEELFRRQDDLPGLTDYYTRWLEQHPKDVEAALRLSDALIELNKKKEAVEWLRKATEWAPNRTEVQVSLARRLSETGQPEEAVTILARLVREKPEDQSFAELLGEAQWLVFEKTKDAALRDAAVESWRKLAPPATRDPAWVGRVADLLRGHRLPELAIAEYRRAITLAPALNDPRERLAEYFFELDRDAEGWAELDALSKMEHADFLRVAKLYGRHNAPEAALAAVQSGLERESKSFDLLSLQWQLLTDAKRWEEALALFDALTEAAPNAYFLDDLEARYLATLSAAGKAEAFQKERVDKLGGGSLGERDLRLLARQLLGVSDLETLRKALDEGQARFPNSFPLARLEAEYARRTGDLEARVKALRRLIELQPRMKSDLLRDIVAAYREQSRWEEALAVVQELVAASPASAEAQALGADVLFAADRFEEGVKKMREAVRLSENPNGLRLRLSRVLLDRGELTRAREVLDEAFEAAEKPSDRLALMPQLSEAYFADGKLDSLIERFRQRQRGEDEGWRYALYLAEIYKQTLDVGAARRELARALAARPKDAGLLRQMVRLATDEENRAEIARYQELLTEAEPSDANQCALIEALLENSQPEPAFVVLQRQYAAVGRMPGAWARLMPLLARQNLLGKLSELLAAQPGGKSNLETRLQFAVVQAVEGQVEEARRLFWSVFALPSPPPPPAVPEKPDPANETAPIYQVTPLEQRYYTSHQTRQMVDRIFNANNYGSSNVFGFAPAKVDPVDAARDTAELYLAALAVKDGKVPEFLAELDRQLAARGSTAGERLLAYGIVQAKDQLMAEMRQQVRRETPDAVLDRFCLGQFVTLVQMNRYANEKLEFDKAEAAAIYEALAARVVRSDKTPAWMWSVTGLYFYASLGMPEKVKALRRELLAKAELTNPEEAAMALGAAVSEGDLAKAKQICQIIAETARKNPTAIAAQRMQWLPASFGSNPGEPMGLTPEGRAEIIAETLALWYPASVPRPGLGGSRGQNYYQGENPLPPTRHFDVQRMGLLANLATQFDSMAGARQEGASSAGLPDLRRRLEDQTKTLPAAQRIFPRLVLIYFDAWSGKDDAAATAVQALLAEEPNDDDLRMLAGALYGRSKKYKEALEVLVQIPPRVGGANVEVQKLLLAYAKLANDQDTARKAALRLVSLQLTSEERTNLAADLRSFGLGEKAAQVAKMASSLARSGNVSYEKAQQLRKFVEGKKEDDALALARQMLGGDPATMVDQDYVVGEALGAFQTFGKLGDFIAETETALATTPDSLRLNFLLARAAQLREAPNGAAITGPVVKLPCWLRLVREGGKITGFHSADGETWTAVGNMTLGLSGEVSAGLVLVGREKTMVTSADFFDVRLEPAGHGAPDGNNDGALPGPWTSRDIGRVEKPGAVAFAENVFKLRAGGGWIGFDADALRFVRQPLAGDGTLTARVTATGDAAGFGEAGLMIRATDDPRSFSASLVVVPGKGVRFKYRFADGSAERYWRKVVELRPGEPKYQQMLARWLQRSGRNDEALALYTALMEKNPEGLIESIIEVIPLYRSAKRLDELVAKASAWVPPAKANRDWSWYFARLATELEKDQRPDLVEKVCRHGLDIATYDDGASLSGLLAKALKAQGRTDEALSTLAAFFQPEPPRKTAGAQPTLGFQSQRYVDARPRWRRSLSSGEDGIRVGGLALIEVARKEGLFPALCTSLLEKLKPDPANDETETRALRAYLKLLQRDPAAVEELRSFLGVKFGEDSAVTALMLAAMREVKSWPGQEKFFLELARVVRPLMESHSFLRHGRNHFLFELARSEEQFGDPALPETLRALAALIVEDTAMRGAQNRPEFRWNDAETCLVLLLRAGLEDDYIAFLDKMKKTPEGANIAYNFEEERKVFRAEKTPQAMVWLNDPAVGEAPASAEIAYELRVEHPHDHGDVFRYMASRLRSIRALEKERTLKFLYGRRRETLVPIGEVMTSSARGTWWGDVPMGAGWLRIAVVEGGAETLSPAVAVFRGTNLIVNPGFEGLANRSAEAVGFDLAGWTTLPAGFWKSAPGGPRGDAVVEYEARADDRDSLLIGQRIALEKGRVYQQSGWLRAIGPLNCDADLGRRYLDAGGKELKTTYCPAWWGYNWRWHSQRLSFEQMPETEQIPAEAAYFQPVIKVRGGAEWSGLFFGGAPRSDLP